MEGRKARQTLLNRTFPATGGGPKSTTAVEWHFKVNM